MQNNVVNIRQSDGSVITFESYKTLYSTAQLAREYANKGYPDRYVVFTTEQKMIDSQDPGEYESGLFMSCILRPSFFPSQAALLGAMSATALANALEEHTDKSLGIGWVSDVYCDGVKIGHTSIEGKLDNHTTYEYLILSFYATLDKENFPPRLTDLIREIFEEENTSVAMIIARNVLNKFFQYYHYVKHPQKFMDEYKAKFILEGKLVRYEHHQKKKLCTVKGVDQKSGALIVDLPGVGEQYVTSPSLVSIPKRISVKKKRKDSKKFFS